MSNPDRKMEVRVYAMRYEASGIISIELRRVDNKALAFFSPGAHITIDLPNGLSRSYSLINLPHDRHRYIIAVSHDAASGGGSRYLHETLRVGDILHIGMPKNNFRLAEAAGRSVFIAGGIGITPIWCMIRRLEELGRDWILHYATRGRHVAAFLAELSALETAASGRVYLHFDEEKPGRYIDIGVIAAAVPATAHLYCCGPIPMLQAFEEATSDRASDKVHVEYFTAGEVTKDGNAFTVVLARSGKKIHVPSGTTILEALLEENLYVPNSCREGICGTCEVAVIEGEPDHRDVVLSADEKAKNRMIMVCCSRSKTPELVLDL